MRKTSSPLNLGFIGGALDSAIGETHKIAAQMDSRWCLTTGCFSTNQEMNRHTGEQWGIDEGRVYDNWQDLIIEQKSNLDALTILSPTPTHAEIVSFALKEGLPVICEKALASSVAEAELIHESLNAHSGFLAVTYNYTGYPMLRELKQKIRNDELGKLNQVIIEMPQEGFLKLNDESQKPVPQEWRLSDGSIPTLALDLGVHVHHIIKFLTNETAQQVTATHNTFGFFEEIIDNTLCIAKYTNNLDCQIWYGKSALGNSNGLRVRIFGEKGSAEWYQQQPENLLFNDKTGNQFTLNRASPGITLANQKRYNRFKVGHPAGFIEAFANHYYDIADSLEKKIIQPNSWVFGIDDAIEGLHFLEAVTESANNLSWQSI